MGLCSAAMQAYSTRLRLPRVAWSFSNGNGTVSMQMAGVPMPTGLVLPSAIQWQNGPNRFSELRRRGVPKFNAAIAAGSPTGFWRMSGHPAVQQALRNHHFDSLGLPRLYVSVQAQPSRTAV